jgi:large subunit ribosomal protein L6
MSRVANNPVAIPAKVEVTLTPVAISVTGPLGRLVQPLKGDVTLNRDGDNITFGTRRGVESGFGLLPSD